MQGEFIEAHDPKWTGFLEESTHDVYHLPGYAELAAEGSASRPIAFIGEAGGARCLIPLVETGIPPHLGDWEGWTDLVSPYGYASPLFVGDPSRFAEILRGFANACAERQSVCAFLRGHPLLDPDWAPEDLAWSDRITRGAIHSEGKTVVIDLGKTDAEIRSELRTDHRRGIDRLLKKGFTWRIDDWSLYGRFVEIYRRTMDRVQASGSYLYSDEYFASMARRLEGRLHLISVLGPDGEVAASGTFFHQGEIIQYHLGGSDPELLRLSPFKLSIHAAIRWGRELGAKHFHLGGGLGARDDALLWFKSGFSDLRRTYRTLAVIGDREVYETLVRASGAEAGGSFFPAYRAVPEERVVASAVSEAATLSEADAVAAAAHGA